MVVDLCFYFLILILSIGWFYVTGLATLKLLKINFHDIETSTLISILVSVNLHVIIFSICKTNFATFNVLLLILLIFIWLEYSKKKRILPGSIPVFNYKIQLKKIAELIAITLFFFLLKSFSFIDSSIYPFFHGGRDDIFYSQVSSFISTHGVESYYLDWASQSSLLGPMPYHYFELWLNALISSVTRLLSVNVYYFVTTVFITTLLYQTVLTMAANLLRIPVLTFKHKILAISLIFIVNLFFGIIGYSDRNGLAFGFLLYNNTKVIIIFIVFVLAWLKWRDGSHAISLLLLLHIPIFNYGLMPIIICTVPVFFIIHRWVLKFPEEIPFKRILLYYAIFAILLSVIQKIFSNKFEGFAALGLNEIISYYDNFSKFKTLLNYVLNNVLKIISLILPFIIIVIPLKKHNLLRPKNSFIVLMSMFLLAALALSCLLYFVSESSQLFTITLNTSFHLFMYTGVFLLFFKVEKYIFYKGLIGVYFMLGFFMLANSIKSRGAYMSRYSANFLKEVMTVGNDIHGQGIRYLTPDYYKSAYNFDPNCNFEGYYLSFLKNDVIIHTVSVKNIPDKKELHDFFNYNKKLALQSSYYLNCINKAGLEKATDETAQLYFIKNNDIDFIVTTKNAVVPSSINKLVYKELVDTFSGEKLMLIDRRKISK